jgi:hypothetical protein
LFTSKNGWNVEPSKSPQPIFIAFAYDAKGINAGQQSAYRDQEDHQDQRGRWRVTAEAER